MRPREARLLCALADPPEAVERLRRAGTDAAELLALLSAPDEFVPPARTISRELTDHGRQTNMQVHVPRSESHRRLGALIVLHGAGDSGAEMLPYFAGLGDRVGMVTICPDAQLLDDGSGNLDVGGIFGKRFRIPRWSFRADDFPLAALRWALTDLDADPDRCILAGQSMGGLATWNLGMRSWQHFAALVPINGALTMWELFGTDRLTRYLLPNVLPLPLFIVHGGQDTRIPPDFDRASVAELQAFGHEALEYVEVPDGTHSLESLHLTEGGELLSDLGTWLRRRRRHAQPAQITHRAIDDQHGRAYWIQASGVDQTTGAQIEACRLAADHYRIDVAGADTVRLYLGGTGLRYGQAVTVVVNGKTAVIDFKPDLGTAAETYHQHADPALAAAQTVDLTVHRAAGTGAREYAITDNHADT
jgi:predicted esterase